MVARMKPVTVGSVTGRTTSTKPNVESLDTPTQPGRFQERKDSFGNLTACQDVGGLKIHYRSKHTDFGEHRRYYVGQVQFGLIAHYEATDIYVVYLTGQDDAPAGNQFSSEKLAEAFLFKQLTE